LPPKLHFGIITLTDLPWPEAVQSWQNVEAVGFDSVWDCDHFVCPGDPTRDWFEGWTLLSALATQTHRIRLGALVTSITLQNPALLARKAMTVDHISNGRLELAIGSGGAPLDYSMTGIPHWEKSERISRFREVVEIVDAMLRQEETTYTGQYYCVEKAAMHPRPLQRPRPPLTIAAHEPKTLEIAAQYADCWNSFAGYSLSEARARELTRQRNEILNEHCLRLGRDPQTIRRSLAGTAEETLFSSLQAFEDFVESYCEIGIHEFIFAWPHADRSTRLSGIRDRDQLEQIATEVIPKIRARQTTADQALGRENP